MFSSCTTMISEPQTIPADRTQIKSKERPETLEEPSPRDMASLRLTEQARMLLERDKVDEAINVLERAINLNPTNGRNYYYLSEAWLYKGNLTQAEEFNHLAAIYLREDSVWMSRVMGQKERIEKAGR